MRVALALLLAAAAVGALKVGGAASAQQEQPQPQPQPPEPPQQPDPEPEAAGAEASTVECAAPGAQLSGLDDEQMCGACSAGVHPHPPTSARPPPARALTPVRTTFFAAPSLFAAAQRPPLGLEFLRVTSPDCRRCLKTCLGGKIQNAQMTFMKIQAPLSLLTWYLFKNRPFTMIPLEKALGKLLQIPPFVHGAAAVGAYLSCRPLCDLDCPYPGGSPPAEELPELENANPRDLSFLRRLYQRPAAGGGRGGGGSFSQALSDMFRLA